MRIRKATGRTSLVFLLMTALASIALSGCTDDPSSGSQTKSSPSSSSKAAPSTTSPSDRTVVVEGKSYGCAEFIDAPESGCSADYQKAFNDYGDRLDGYINDGRLGPLVKDIRYEDVAASGLAACIIAARGETQQEFIDFMRRSYPNEDSTVFLPLWFRALEQVCPELRVGGGDQELP